MLKNDGFLQFTGPAKTGEQWLAEVKRLRKGITLGGTVTIRQLIDEGCKY